MLNWSFVRFLHCVSFLPFQSVCGTVPPLPLPCILSLFARSHWSLLHEKGTNSSIRIVLEWESSWGVVGFYCSVVVLSIALARKTFLVSAVCSLSAVKHFVLSDFQFSWHTFSSWLREALSEEPGLWRKKEEKFCLIFYTFLGYSYFESINPIQ